MVFFKSLSIFKEFLIFGLVGSMVLLLFRLVICHIKVLKTFFFNLFLSPAEIAFDFLLESEFLLMIIWSVFNGLSHLNSFEMKSDTPVLQEFFVLLFLIERWSEQLLTPVW